MQEKLIDELAARVKRTVISKGVQKDVLDVLLHEVEQNAENAAREALLLLVGAIVRERDAEWLKHLTGEWAPKSGLRSATTPEEVVKEIYIWHDKRLKEVEVDSFKAGYGDGWLTGNLSGAKTGWASREAGATLEGTVVAAKKARPSEW